MLVVASGWFWRFAKNQDGGKTSLAPAGKSDIFSDKDADGDGLKDWEETLWGTDANNQDSDSDGTPDGEEVKAGRNPASKGPDDKLATGNASVTEENFASEEPKNLTELLARQLVVNYLYQKSSGGDQPQEAASVLQQSLGQESYEDSFSKKDLKIIPDKKREDKISYLNAAGKILARDFDGIEGNELSIMIGVLRSQDNSQLSELEKFRGPYAGALKNLLALAVPEEYAGAHLELLNILKNSERSGEDMKKLPDDPFQALVGISEYFRVASRMVAYLSKINSQMDRDGIILTSGDSGFLLVDYHLKAEEAKL